MWPSLSDEEWIKVKVAMLAVCIHTHTKLIVMLTLL